MTSRELALAVVRDVFPRNGRARAAHEAFDYRARRSGLDLRDRAFAAELAYGSIKTRRFLDWVLEPYVGERSQTLPPTIHEILRLGAYQLRGMRTEARAAVSESVALAKKHGHRGTAGLVNAVLRRVAENDAAPEREAFEDDDDFLATLLSFPTWIVTAVRAAFGDAAVRSILEGMNAQAQLALCVDVLRASPESALEALAEQGVTARRSPLVPEILLVEEARAGIPEDARWRHQGESAAIPADLLAPPAGAFVLELCSGRGNKTLQLAGRIGVQGTIETIERDPQKVLALRERLAALGVHNVATVEGDAIASRGEEAAYVLLDAPCSGLGILGRQPEARWRKDPDDPAAMALLQAALLEAAARRTAPGGRLIYAVCTFDSREGREQIAAFLRARPDFSRGELPARYRPWRTPEGDLLLPPGLDRRDGFFIAILERAPR